MSNFSATAVACPNIAFIKYWGNRDDSQRLPVNGSISMNLEGLFTRTSVNFLEGALHDELILNGQPQQYTALQRVSDFLQIVRSLAGIRLFAQVSSFNNFPTGAGIASSAAAFAALSASASKAAGLNLTEQELSRLARRGSGSASRSVPAGFVEWQLGSSDQDSFAVSIAQPSFWDIVDCIAIVQSAPKPVGSTEGHTIAGSSILQAARVADAPHRLEICRNAILNRDFDQFARITELDSNLMHAVMMTSTPALFYWEPASIQIMKSLPELRKHGLPVAYTLDAGPNVHVLTISNHQNQVKEYLLSIPGVQQVLTARAGAGVQFVAP